MHFACLRRLSDEVNTRKKMENAFADAQRVIADKESQLQDARVTVTQHQNAHMDTKQDRDNLQSSLTQTQQALDTEAAARADLLTLVGQLRDKLNFQQQLHEKVCRSVMETLIKLTKHLAKTCNWSYNATGRIEA